MTQKIQNKVKLIIPLLVLSVFSLRNAHAALNCNYGATEGSVPLPSQIICPIIKVVNLGLILSGVVLVVFIGYGAIRLAVSLGDPKGYQASMRNFLFAVIGFFVVVAAFSILFMLNKTLGLGLGYDSAGGIVENIQQLWADFLLDFLYLDESTSI